MDDSSQHNSIFNTFLPESPESPTILGGLSGASHPWPGNQLSGTYTVSDESHEGNAPSGDRRVHTWDPVRFGDGRTESDTRVVQSSANTQQPAAAWNPSLRYQRLVYLYDENGIWPAPASQDDSNQSQLAAPSGSEGDTSNQSSAVSDVMNPDMVNEEPIARNTVNEELLSPVTVNEEPINPDPVNEEPIDRNTVNEELLSPVTVNEELLSPVTVNEELLSPVTVNEEFLSPVTVNEELLSHVTVNEEPIDRNTINEELLSPVTVNEEPINPDPVNEEPIDRNTVNEELLSPVTVNEEPIDRNTVNEEPRNLDKDNEANNPVNEEPPAKVRKLNTSIQDDGETCPICLDSWGNSGAHRLVSLKCGHLFGAQCVERWLKGQPAKERSCPTCKTKASLKDLRFLYARKLVAADTSQITGLQKQIDILQAEKNRSELELEKSRIAHRACMLQLEDLRNALLKKQAREQPQRRSWRFALEKNLEINREGGCRVLTYNCRTYELYVSQKSTNYLFPGFGIRKVSCVDYKLGQFLHLHPKPIRDITYSQPRDLLLSVGLDNTARIVERGILSHTIQCQMPLWSCSWDYLRSNEFYVGGIGGAIQQYDIRNPGTHIQTLNITGDLSPVVSLVSTEHGLLSCQLNSCWLWMSNMRQWERKSLPVDGPFMSLSYDKDTHKVLVSCRASGNERSRLSLCKLRNSNINSASVSSSDVVIEYDQTFPGSARTSVMCRSAFVKAPGARWVASHSESDAALHLHGVEGARTMSLPASEPAVDVCTARGDPDTVLAALSDSRLRLYRAVPTS